MKAWQWAAAALAGCVLGGCSGPDKTVATKQPAATAKPPEPVRITQFYTSTPQVPRGEKGLVCYGVENAKTVWISPPRQELAASMSRCIEVTPSGKVTYVLTAEGADGSKVTKDVTLEAEGSRPHPSGVRILNVNISAAEVNAGDAVSVCYKVENAQSVTVTPGRTRNGKENDGCVVDQPQKTTTYVIKATGANGETDQERVTIKVRSR